MGRQSLLSRRQATAVTMKVLLILAIAASQINCQHGDMGGSGMEGSGSGMGGSGYGMGGYGYGMGSGYGGEWPEWMQMGGYGGGECCPTKKIWDHWDQDKNGIYDLVMDGDMMNGMGSGYGGYGMNMGYGGMGMGGGYGGMGMDMGSMDWPRRCRSRCAYRKRDSYDDRMYCFARSEYSQSMCMRDDYDGENGE